MKRIDSLKAICNNRYMKHLMMGMMGVLFAALSAFADTDKIAILDSASVDTLESGVLGKWTKLKAASPNLEKGWLYEITGDFSGARKISKRSRGIVGVEDVSADGKTRSLGSARIDDASAPDGRFSFMAPVFGDVGGLNVVFVVSGKFKGAIKNVEAKKVLPLTDRNKWIFAPSQKPLFIGMLHTPFDPVYADYSRPYFKMEKEGFFPFIDKYGQFKYADWPRKIKSDADYKTRLETERAWFEKNPPISGRDIYGGLVCPEYKFPKTKHFTTRKVDGKWFFITPEGNLFWSLGIDCWGRHQPTFLKNREHYFEDLTDKRGRCNMEAINHSYLPQGEVAPAYNFTKVALIKKYGEGAKGEASYVEILKKRSLSWGVNTIGSFSLSGIDLMNAHGKNMPYVLFLGSVAEKSIDSRYHLEQWHRKFPEFFDGQFAQKTNAAIARFASLIDSPWCIGVMIDGELPWQDRVGELARGVLSCPSTQESKIEFKKMLEKKYSDISNLNKAWRAEYKSWRDFLETRDFLPATPAAEADLADFEEYVCAFYFRTCKDALRAVSKDVLYLGTANGSSMCNPLLVKVSAEYSDVISYTHYKDDASDLFKTPQSENVPDRPVLITEFHFGNGDEGTFGAGLSPRKTVAQKVAAYKKYVDYAISRPEIVGVHWFQYCDQPATGTYFDENYAVGFVDINDTPQYEMAEASRAISEDMYKKRLKAE